MSRVSLPAIGDRLTQDERVAQLEEQLRAAALVQRERQAALAPRGVPGTCSNCDEPCQPHTVYCDEYCREDHESREAVRARQYGRR